MSSSSSSSYPKSDDEHLHLCKLEALHSAAFDDLRKATAANEECFIERLRRLEEQRKCGSTVPGAVPGIVDEEDDDDEVEFTIEVGGGPTSTTMPSASRKDVDDLSCAMGGGTVLEDYGEVREWQKRLEERAREVIAS
ncbi:hypothetical protein MNV49_007330 [Pseudohyphozyma bogoriensis]|nr:hypothetical protein MNV49_007330 [Pseudohyphozyma bogoriensis]